MRKRKWIWWLGGGLVLLVLLCSGTTLLLGLSGRSAMPAAGAVEGDFEMAKAAPFMEEPAAIMPEMAVEASRDLPMDEMVADEALYNEAPRDRMVIKTADLAVVVEDPRAAQEQVIAWVEAHGGYVVSSSFSERVLPSGKRVLYGELQFRIPADRFLEAVETVKSLAVRVDREDIAGQDVTDEYVDLEARLRNLQAAEEELRRLLDEAANTNEVLNIYRELTRVREQIEVLQGRLRYLKESVAYSSVRVEFIPVEADEPVSIGGWEPQGVVRDAIRALLRAGQVLVTGLIWIVVFWLPVLLVLGVVVFLAWRLGRWVWRKAVRPHPRRDEAPRSGP